MTGFTDQLARAKARPALVEDAIRTALRDAIAWRSGGGAAPDAEAFAAAAVAAARQSLDALVVESAERSRTLSGVRALAQRFIRSALGRRLMTVPAMQFIRLPAGTNGPDAIVRDRRRRIHSIVLRLRPDPLEASRIADNVAAATALSRADRLSPITVHIQSLATNRRYAFQRDLAPRAGDIRVA